MDDRMEILGAVRLAHEAGHLGLRGMEIAVKWRRRGIGTELLLL